MNLKHIQKTHTLQHDQSDCGVACLLSLLKYYGGHQSLERLRELSGTTKEGTTLLGLYQVANQLGFTAEGCEADLPALIAHEKPVILHVVIGEQLQHYVVCYGYSATEGFLIGDPAEGVRYLDATTLDTIWVSKACLTLEPNTSFVQEAITKTDQRRWFKELLEPDFTFLGISTLLGIFVAGLGMGMALFSQKLIDDILPAHNTNKLIAGIGLLTVLLLAKVGLGALREYFLMWQAKEFNNRVNSYFFDALLQLPKPFFDTRKIGELVARLNDTQRIQSVIRQLAGNVVIDTLITITTIVFLFIYSVRLGCIALLTLPLYFLIIYRSNKAIIAGQKEVMQTYAHSESNYINTLQGIATIKNTNKQAHFSQLNQSYFGQFQEKKFGLGKINIRLSWQSGVATVVFLIGILSYTSFLVFDKTLKIGELMAILSIVGSLLPSIANLALITIPINEAKIAFDRMYEFTAIKTELQEGEALEAIDSVHIQNASFRFAGRSPLFENVNMRIDKGNFVAIVGESGCGKSTLGQILQGFYTLERGNITLNNTFDLSSISLSSYRKLIGVVPQEIAIFNGNVIDNITLGSSITPEEILSFIQHYGFETYFAEFPQGLATLLGEEGINLSGGQKQIIGLARALFTKPQFLIMDEATAAMDRNTEHFCMELLQNIKQNCGIFFISHRLQTLNNKADYIYIMENKSISTHGKPEELMQTKNFYSDYFLEQG